jgi:hypothetical protein
VSLAIGVSSVLAAVIAALALGRRAWSERIAAGGVAAALTFVGGFVLRAAYDAAPRAPLVVSSAVACVVLVDALRRPGRP